MRIKTLPLSYKNRIKYIHQAETPFEIIGRGLGFAFFLNEIETDLFKTSELHFPWITAVYYEGKHSSVLNYAIWSNKLKWNILIIFNCLYNYPLHWKISLI